MRFYIIIVFLLFLEEVTLTDLNNQNGSMMSTNATKSTEMMSDIIKNFNASNVPLVRLTRDIFAPDRYEPRTRPTIDHTTPIAIHLSLSLYQIIDVNEKEESIRLNLWMTQKWWDEVLTWDPREYANIIESSFPHEELWTPDTYVYNSLIMNEEETERRMKIHAKTRFWEGQTGANISFLYPAIYTFTCNLNMQYFPYDQQNCTLIISSWSNSISYLDYYADAEVDMDNYVPNGEWDVVSFKIFRHETKRFDSAEPWVILHASLVFRRKPLYYILNLVVPTSIITLISIIGFFTPTSTSGEMTENVNLGITTLLSMSIFMLMVSDQMPTSSEVVPLMAWFYLSIIIIVSICTLISSALVSVQLRGGYGVLPKPIIRYFFFGKLANLLWVSVEPKLPKLWEELDDHPIRAYRKHKNQIKPRKNKIMPQDDLQTVTTTVANGNCGINKVNPSNGDTPPASKEVIKMKRRRQCLLEWEFLATILDRLFLIIFGSLTVFITIGILVIGKMAQVHYDEIEGKTA